MQEVAAIKSLFRLLSGSERRTLLAISPLLAISSLVEMVGVGAIFLYLGTLNALVESGSLSLPFGVGEVSLRAQDFALAGGLALLAVFIAKAFIIIGIHFMLMRLVFRSFERFSADLFKAYLHAPLWFHFGTSSAEIQSNINLQSTVLFNSVGVSVSYIASNSLAIIVLCAVLAWLDPLTFLVAVSVLTFVCGLSYALHRRRLSRIGARRIAFSGAAVKWVAQAIGAIREIKIGGHEAHFERLFREQVHGLGLADRALRVSAQVPGLTNEITLATGVVIVVLFYLHSGGSLPDVLPILAAFGLAGVRVMGMLASIVGHLHQLQYYGPAVQTILKAKTGLDAQASESAGEAARGLPIRLRSDITFDRVSFHYPGSQTSAISEVSFVISRGRRVAVVGTSGSGKSTLAMIAAGLLDPTRGSVLVDGVPIAADRAAWFRKIGYVPQNVFILDDTLRANVTFEFEGPTEDAALWEVLEIAQLEETVRRMPMGLDTPLGEGASALSGGERQRFGIARALYRRPEVLILDEATSALDGATETRLVTALIQHCSGTTIIAIAHRASLARVSDMVLWMEQGRIVACGGYDELLLRSPGFGDVLAR